MTPPRPRPAAARPELLALLVLAIGALDLLTGPRIGVSIFYVAPIALATWWLGRPAGLGMSVLSAMAWLVAELYWSPRVALPVIPLWNMGVRLAFFVLITHLIATRQQIEAELRRAREAAELANRAKDQFLLRVNHELRTPLTAIIGFSSRLRRNQRRNLHEADLLCVDRIHQNGVELLRMVGELLDLGRIVAGTTEVRSAPLALPDLVAEVAASFELETQGRPVRIVVEVPERCAPVHSDAQRLRQVLSNLVANGLKFTDAGEVTLAVVAEPATGRATRIDVRDTGPGVGGEGLARLFEPFYQGQTAGGRGGAGLGLAICKEICGLLGLGLAVSSTPGRGSTFSVLFSAAGVPEDPGTEIVLPPRDLPARAESLPTPAA